MNIDCCHGYLVFLVVSYDGGHVPQKVVQDRTAMLRTQLSYRSRQHVLSFTRTQHVNQQLFIDTPVGPALTNSLNSLGLFLYVGGFVQMYFVTLYI